MYLLFSPCIGNPDLRAQGITHDRDRDAWNRALTRCSRYGVKIRFLPCPETRFLGLNRHPATFSERFDTPEFTALLDLLEEDVRSLIADFGPPLFIVGVDSSPSCGVNRNWKSSAGREPGRGVFLARFADIPAYDICTVAIYRIYLAGPLFSEAERTWNLTIAEYLRSYAYDVYLPQETGDTDACRGEDAHLEIFHANHAALHNSDMVVAVIDGADADSGTAWEMGYAYARGIPVIAIRTDFRMAGAGERVNLMLEKASVVVTDIQDIRRVLPCPIPLPRLHSEREEDNSRDTDTSDDPDHSPVSLFTPDHEDKSNGSGKEQPLRRGRQFTHQS
jgi:nucleoside 2-deoxyribosyltransferase/predicted secreted protein